MAALTLEQYLSDIYPDVAKQLDELTLYIRQSARLLSVSCMSDGKGRGAWPYSYPHNLSSVPSPVSISTQAMCITAVNKLLTFDLPQDLKTHLHEQKTCVSSTAYAQIRDAVQAKGSAWESHTFGKEDVFTASWLIEVLAADSSAPVEVTNKTVDIIRAALAEAQKYGFERTLFNHPGGQNEAGPHPLPLLRVLQSAARISSAAHLNKFPLPTACNGRDPISKEMLVSAGHWFERNLHRQMSFYRFSDFRFDAAEMIFCLAGALHTGALSPYDDAIRNVLTIVKDAQERSVYWRPYRPMISTQTGLTLLPLSIEVADTLLNTLKETQLFGEYDSTLAKYYRWLVSQRVLEDRSQGTDPTKWAGWHSENAYESEHVHVWDTARVGMFFLGYQIALDHETQLALRRSSGFTIIGHLSVETHLNDSDLVPFDSGFTENLITRLKSAVAPSSFSLLLYGPPGVSKTTIAKAIAAEKQWDLVYVTPSDFISGGESAIEHRAKLVFDGLMKLKNVLVFFDEIDRLLLDRDSPQYGEQGDIFQFMTPSMLSKLSDLRKVDNLGFIIATNYAERIDKAIKRQGRIDRPVLCLPANKKGRAQSLKGFVSKYFPDGQPWSEEEEGLVQAVAKEIPLYVYEETKSFVAAVARLKAPSRKELLQNLKEAKKPSAAINVASYTKRLTATNFTQKPTDEYLCLLAISVESGRSTSDDLYQKIRENKADLDISTDVLALFESCGLKSTLDKGLNA